MRKELKKRIKELQNSHKEHKYEIPVFHMSLIAFQLLLWKLFHYDVDHTDIVGICVIKSACFIALEISEFVRRKNVETLDSIEKIKNISNKDFSQENYFILIISITEIIALSTQNIKNIYHVVSFKVSAFQYIDLFLVCMHQLMCLFIAILTYVRYTNSKPFYDKIDSILKYNEETK